MSALDYKLRLLGFIPGDNGTWEKNGVLYDSNGKRIGSSLLSRMPAVTINPDSVPSGTAATITQNAIDSMPAPILSRTKGVAVTNAPDLTLPEAPAGLASGIQQQNDAENAALAEKARMTMALGPSALKIYDFPAEEQLLVQQARKQSPAHFVAFQNNGLSSLKSRQNWVGQNSEYLKSLGWTDDEISGYQGLNLTNAQRAKLNMRLAGQIAGAKAWNEARPSAEEVARRKAEASMPLQSRAPSAPGVRQSLLPSTQLRDIADPDERFVKGVYASGRPFTDLEIYNLDPRQANYLSDADYRRYYGAREVGLLKNKNGGKINYYKFFK